MKPLGRPRLSDIIWNLLLYVLAVASGLIVLIHLLLAAGVLRSVALDAEARAALAAKLTQLDELGLDILAILFDDMRGDLHAQKQYDT